MIFVLPSFEQPHRIINIAKASPEYSLKVEVVPDDGSDEPLRGSASVTIVSRSNGRPLQTIRMSEIAIFKDQRSTYVGPNGKQPELYDDQYSFVFEDFNFDGHPDLAICRDIQGSYGAMQYDIFLWNPAKHRFVRDAQLTKLSSEHLGLIELDARKHEIITYDKSGAAWHLTSTYKYAKGRAVLIETEEDDATGQHEVITTKRLIGMRWQKRVKIVR